MEHNSKVAPIRRTYPRGETPPLGPAYRPSGPDFWTSLPQFDAEKERREAERVDREERERFNRMYEIHPAFEARDGWIALLLVMGTIGVFGTIAFGVWRWVSN